MRRHHRGRVRAALASFHFFHHLSGNGIHFTTQKKTHFDDVVLAGHRSLIRN